MISELLRLEKSKENEFHPNLCSGDFDWVEGKFVKQEK